MGFPITARLGRMLASGQAREGQREICDPNGIVRVGTPLTLAPGPLQGRIAPLPMVRKPHARAAPYPRARGPHAQGIGCSFSDRNPKQLALRLRHRTLYVAVPERPVR